MIPADIRNPGHVFACIGLLEIAAALDLPAAGDHIDGRFAIADSVDIRELLEWLVSADIVALTGDPTITAERWGIPTELVVMALGTQPETPATLPCELREGGVSVRVDYWAAVDGRSEYKLWSGMGGTPGCAVMDQCIDMFRRADLDTIAIDPLNYGVPMNGGALRMDMRGSVRAVDAGFSVGNHNKMLIRGYPIVEVLAAIGLTHARPQRVDRLTYRYGVPLPGAVPTPLLTHRILLGVPESLSAAPVPSWTPIGPRDYPRVPRRTFDLRLQPVAERGYARCVASVMEAPA